MKNPTSSFHFFPGGRVTAAWLAAILLLVAFFRSLGLFLQHSTVDSLHYVALAMKLQTAGFHG